MKLRQATALTLVGWCLMRPPLPHLNAHAIHVAAAAPLSGWVIVRTLPTERECEAQRANPWDQCIATDDPRLEEK